MASISTLQRGGRQDILLIEKSSGTINQSRGLGWATSSGGPTGGTPPSTRLLPGPTLKRRSTTERLGTNCLEKPCGYSTGVYSWYSSLIPAFSKACSSMYPLPPAPETYVSAPTALHAFTSRSVPSPPTFSSDSFTTGILSPSHCIRVLTVSKSRSKRRAHSLL